MKVGVIVDCFKEGLYEGIRLAAKVGADGVQFTNRTPEIHPDNVTPAIIKEVKDMVSSFGMEITSYCSSQRFDFSKAGIEAGNIENTKRMMDVALELGVNMLNSHIGHANDPLVRHACEEIAAYCESVGGFYSIETGPETSEELKDFIESIGSPALKVNLDPANLVMIHGENASESARILGKHTIHTHAKDGRLLYKPEGRTFYETTPEERKALSEKGIKFFTELPLGEGDVNFPEYIAALKKAGFDGYLTIEREAGDNRYEDIKNGVAFLKSLI